MLKLSFLLLKRHLFDLILGIGFCEANPVQISIKNCIILSHEVVANHELVSGHIDLQDGRTAHHLLLLPLFGLNRVVSWRVHPVLWRYGVIMALYHVGDVAVLIGRVTLSTLSSMRNVVGVEDVDATRWERRVSRPRIKG